MKIRRIEIQKLSEISEQEEYYRGTKLRHYNVGMNVSKKTDDFYDYMLTYLPWDSEWMILVNVTANNSKEGSVYGGNVPIDTTSGKTIVNKKSFQHTFGKDLTNWVLIKETFEK